MSKESQHVHAPSGEPPFNRPGMKDFAPDPAEVLTLITDAYSAVEHALTYAEGANKAGTADEVDGYPEDADHELRRALRALRAASRVYTPSAEDA